LVEEIRIVGDGLVEVEHDVRRDGAERAGGAQLGRRGARIEVGSIAPELDQPRTPIAGGADGTEAGQAMMTERAEQTCIRSGQTAVRTELEAGEVGADGEQFARSNSYRGAAGRAPRVWLRLRDRG